MQWICEYGSPLGEMLLSADAGGLTGAWFMGQKYFASTLGAGYEKKECPVLTDAMRWLDLYFSGQDPGRIPSVHFIGTAFQITVWEILCSIPYGETITYGAIAEMLAQRRGLVCMSAQAVGNAVGRNPISVIVPCHRVIGAGGKLTGYAGGLERKIALLRTENKEFL